MYNLLKSIILQSFIADFSHNIRWWSWNKISQHTITKEVATRDSYTYFKLKDTLILGCVQSLYTIMTDCVQCDDCIVCDFFR